MLGATHQFLYLKKIVLSELDLGSFSNAPDDIEGIYCQIIRFGTDQYIEKMVSDQEKFEERLNNDVFRVSTFKDDQGSYVVRLRLPVHKRLGTQFELFLRLKPEGKSDSVVNFLNEIESVSDVKLSLFIKTHPKFLLLRALFQMFKLWNEFKIIFSIQCKRGNASKAIHPA